MADRVQSVSTLFNECVLTRDHSQTALGAANVTENPQNNILLRMIAWVEEGEAPVTVTGTKFVNVSTATDYYNND